MYYTNMHLFHPCCIYFTRSFKNIKYLLYFKKIDEDRYDLQKIFTKVRAHGVKNYNNNNAFKYINNLL